MLKDILKFENLIHDKPIKIQNGRYQKKFKMAAIGLNITIFFTKNTLKLKFKVVVLVVMVSQI